ncbi:PKD domain-containing protein [Methanoregula sp.]|uniref:PKD domain-containing protein n=1 Tax=Methanoregula sp. TaxID=2052170 RepID=UPI0035690D5A
MTRTRYITAFSSAPEAYFTFTPTFGTAPALVTFTDSSTRSPTSWSWSFGDGDTSTLQNPVHTYSAPGNYIVTLTATNAAGSNIITRTFDVYTTSPVNVTVANFTAVQTSYTNLTIVTSSASSINATSWNWSFGDGYTSTLQHPLHTYSAPGTYIVSLTTTSNEIYSSTPTKGRSNAVPMVTSSTITMHITVYGLAPQPDFTSNLTSGSVPLPVKFTDSSTRSPTSWNWSFGDGGTSTLQNPEHIYSAPGTYTVSLKATNTIGNDTIIRTGYIKVSAFSPEAYFTGTPTAGPAPLPVKFTDNSTRYPTSWNWSFGDGGTSTVQNPEHIYSAPGIYTVSLKATNAIGSDSIIRTGYISVTNVTSAPTVTGITPSSGLNNGIVSITNLAGTGFYGTPTVYLVKTSQSSIIATDVRVVDSTKITCSFNLAGKPAGLWDVTVVNPDGQQGSLVEGFMISATPPTPTPTEGSDDTVPVQSGQSGSGTAIANGAPAAQTVSYSFGIPSSTDPVSIQSVSFVPNRSISQSQCVVQQQEPSSAIGLTGRPAAYEKIEIAWINPNVITSGTIHFSVLGSWLREKHIDPANVVLLRNHDLVWTELPTTFESTNGDIHYYQSDTPGFSYFAVSERLPAPTVTATPQAEVSPAVKVQPVSPSVTVTAITTPDITKPAPANEGGSPVVYPTPAPSPSIIPVPAIILLAAGIILICAAGVRSLIIRKRPHKTRVLIVDDEPDIVDVFSYLLEENGYDTIKSSSGGECLSLLADKKNHPDVILLDIMMFPMDGWETLEKIKKDPVLRKIPVLMLTGKQLLPEEAKRYGICIEDYIPKPVTPSELYAAIEYTLNRKKKIEGEIQMALRAGTDKALVCEYARLTKRVDVDKKLVNLLKTTYTKVGETEQGILRKIEDMANDIQQSEEKLILLQLKVLVSPSSGSRRSF